MWSRDDTRMAVAERHPFAKAAVLSYSIAPASGQAECRSSRFRKQKVALRELHNSYYPVCVDVSRIKQ